MTFKHFLKQNIINKTIKIYTPIFKKISTQFFKKSLKYTTHQYLKCSLYNIPMQLYQFLNFFILGVYTTTNENPFTNS